MKVLASIESVDEALRQQALLLQAKKGQLSPKFIALVREQIQLLEEMKEEEPTSHPWQC